jgi:uncharacterized membrane protein
MLISLLLLMATSFLPFPTKLMAEAIHDEDATRAAVIFYGGSLLVISLLLSLLNASVRPVSQYSSTATYFIAATHRPATDPRCPS